MKISYSHSIQLDKYNIHTISHLYISIYSISYFSGTCLRERNPQSEFSVFVFVFISILFFLFHLFRIQILCLTRFSGSVSVSFCICDFIYEHHKYIFSSLLVHFKYTMPRGPLGRMELPLMIIFFAQLWSRFPFPDPLDSQPPVKMRPDETSRCLTNGTCSPATSHYQWRKELGTLTYWLVRQIHYLENEYPAEGCKLSRWEGVVAL